MAVSPRPARTGGDRTRRTGRLVRHYGPDRGECLGRGCCAFRRASLADLRVPGSAFGNVHWVGYAGQRCVRPLGEDDRWFATGGERWPVSAQVVATHGWCRFESPAGDTEHGWSFVRRQAAYSSHGAGGGGSFSFNRTSSRGPATLGRAGPGRWTDPVISEERLVPVACDEGLDRLREAVGHALDPCVSADQDVAVLGQQDAVLGGKHDANR